MFGRPTPRLIWLASDSRNNVASASQTIESMLGDHPILVGETLSEGLKALDEPPLRVLFEIIDDDMIVRILNVKSIASRSR